MTSTTQPAPGPPSEPVPEAPSEPASGAAGVICWRPGRDGDVEVLLVHHRDDGTWSFPQGGPERREDPPECAVRQAARQTGAQVRLGRPLGAVPGPAPHAAVTYWAARTAGREPDARRRRDERVDEVRWLPPDRARAALGDGPDAEALARLDGYARDGSLATVATLVVRHATARPRDSWTRTDADRPLVASGRRQAMALGALLQCWRPEHVVSSPWRRCLETMGPYLAATGARLRTKGGLSEAGHRRRPGKAARHVRDLLESTHCGALCTHRPVLGEVLDAVRAWSAPDVAGAIPAANPYLHPGDVLVAHVVHRGGRQPLVVAVERHGTR